MHNVPALCLHLLTAAVAAAAGLLACARLCVVRWVTARQMLLLCACRRQNSDGAVVEAEGDGLQQLVLMAMCGGVLLLVVRPLTRMRSGALLLKLLLRPTTAAAPQRARVRVESDGGGGEGLGQRIRVWGTGSKSMMIMAEGC